MVFYIQFLLYHKEWTEHIFPRPNRYICQEGPKTGNICRIFWSGERNILEKSSSPEREREREREREETSGLTTKLSCWLWRPIIIWRTNWQMILCSVGHVSSCPKIKDHWSCTTLLLWGSGCRPGSEIQLLTNSAKTHPGRPCPSPSTFAFSKSPGKGRNKDRKKEKEGERKNVILSGRSILLKNAEEAKVGDIAECGREEACSPLPQVDRMVATFRVFRMLLCVWRSNVFSLRGEVFYLSS